MTCSGIILLTRESDCLDVSLSSLEFFYNESGSYLLDGLFKSEVRSGIWIEFSLTTISEFITFVLRDCYNSNYAPS